MTDISHIVALSPEGQIVIPKDILDALGLPEGACLSTLAIDLAALGFVQVVRAGSSK